ncbi:class I SAM-dependent methyltransferase [bacterium]|nr:class I SAM-dependent methyltransferase [bacterium]
MAFGLVHCSRPGNSDPVGNGGLSASSEPSSAVFAPPVVTSLSGTELENVCNQLGAQIAEVLDTRNFDLTAWTEQAEKLFPKLKVVWRMYAKCATPGEIETVPEAKMIYQYLFGDDTRTEATLRRLAALLCWGRLDRTWFLIRVRPNRDLIEPWMACPLVAMPYVADQHQVSCPMHGISLTFPDHFARPPLDELSRQLFNGEFNGEYRRCMDDILLKEPRSAIKIGETVADIGCGVGGNTLTMSQAVGLQGEVIASDIDGDVLGFIDFFKEYYDIKNISTLKVSDIDPGFKPNTIDRAFMIDLFNDLAGKELVTKGKVNSRTERYMQKVAESLKAGGTFVVVDRQPSEAFTAVPAPLMINYLSGFGLREVSWYNTKLGGVDKLVVIMQKQSD